jgi:hypothetical protein
MAILIRFTPSGLTTEQYEAVGQKLQDGGNWPPDGLLAHVCFGTNGNLRVSEVWESREQMERFGERLRPVLQEENVDLSGEPEVLEVEGYFMIEASSQAGH